MATTARTDNKVLGFLPLLAVVVGSVVGAGIFTSPAQLGRGANPGFIIIGWLVTGVGIFSLVKIFQYLGDKRPELEGGIYSYARDVAGEFTGFNSAYGYWWSVLFGNLSYFFAIPGILAIYIPVIGENNWVALAVSSALLWGYFALIMSGIKTAGIANVVITLLKLTPLVFVAGVAVFLFRPEVFGSPFALALASDPTVTASAMDQITSCFNVMVWTFLGVEGAVVMSNKAKNPKDVGRVTVIGFGITLLLYIMVSVLSLGVVPVGELMASASPLGDVLALTIGNLGKHFLNFGFLFSVMGALLSWLLLTAETPFIGAYRDGAFPKAFARQNEHATPTFSLLVSTLISQAVLLLFYAFAGSGTGLGDNAPPILIQLYWAATSLAVICALVPYSLSGILGVREALKEKRKAPIAYAALSILFFIAVFAAMWKYALAAVVIYATGIVVRLLVMRERGRRLPRGEVVFYAIMIAASIAVFWAVSALGISF